MIDLTQDPPRTYEGSWDIRVFGGVGLMGVLHSVRRIILLALSGLPEEGVYRVRLHVDAFGPKDWQGASPKLGLALFLKALCGVKNSSSSTTPKSSSLSCTETISRGTSKRLVIETGVLNTISKCQKRSMLKVKKVPFGIHISEIEVEVR